MRLADIPNLRLTSRQKRMLAEVVNDRQYGGKKVICENNWHLLPAVGVVHHLEDAIDFANENYDNEEFAALAKIVMKVTEFTENE